MFGFVKVELLEEVGVLSGLVIVQLFGAVSVILVGYIMSSGVNPLFLIIAGNLTTSLLYFPLSLIFERILLTKNTLGLEEQQWNKWPTKFSLKLLSQFLLISFAGITLVQTLILYGVKKTSPALASIMPNLAPGFIFIIASILRYEKIDMKCFYSKIKIIGTSACVVGAILMSSMSHNASEPISLDDTSSSKALDQEIIIGTACLLVAIIIMSFNIILQAAALNDFPAPISLNVITSFLGAIFTAIMQLITEHKLEIGSQHVTLGTLIGFSILGSIIAGACGCFQAWAMKKKGPVFVSTITPVGTVFSVILSALTLGYAVTMIGLAGMLLIFAGLYSVLWAKKKEIILVEDEEIANVYEIRKPLLS